LAQDDRERRMAKYSRDAFLDEDIVIERKSSPGLVVKVYMRYNSESQGMVAP